MPSISKKNILMGPLIQPNVMTAVQDLNVAANPRLPLGNFEPIGQPTGVFLPPDIVLQPIKVPITPDLSSTIPGVHRVQMLDAGMWLTPVLLGQLTVLLQPKPRSEITFPISPDATPKPETVFEDPVDPNKKFALPIFNLSTQTVEGVSRLRVAFDRVEPFDPANPIWQLTVRFEAARRRTDASDLPFTSTVHLLFTGPDGPQERIFVVEKEDAATMKASLQLLNIGDLSAVVSALKSSTTRFIIRCSISVAVPDQVKDGLQLYMQGVHHVDVPQTTLPSFFFDERLFPYIFSEVQGTSHEVKGVISRQLEYGGRTHNYFQDGNRPHIFFYVPDAFKVTRGIELPFHPQMRVRFRSEDGSLAKMKTSVEYVAAPVIDAERLKAAQKSIKEMGWLPARMPPGLTEAIFEPLLVDEASQQLTLNLAVPRNGISTRQSRTGVVKKLTEGFSDEIADLSLEDFQGLFDALFGKSAVVFTGDVFVAKSGNRPEISIPFSARLDDLYGQLLEENETSGTEGRITVKLKNGIESPITIRSMPVHIFSDQTRFDAHVENITKAGAAAQFPVDLAPAEELSLDVVPDELFMAGASSTDALFELDDVKVTPATEAVWDAILDDSVPAQYTRTITVEGFSQWFAPGTNLLGVAIDFENGDHVMIKSDNLKQEGHVDIPLRDLILKKVQSSEYKYTQTIIRTTGQTVTEKTAKGDLIVPDVTI